MNEKIPKCDLANVRALSLGFSKAQPPRSSLAESFDRQLEVGTAGNATVSCLLAASASGFKGAKNVRSSSAMKFGRAFFRTLLWRPRVAIAALFWHVFRRRVRARNLLRLAGSQAPFAYQQWIETVERLPDVAHRVAEIVAGWQRRPSFSVILLLRDGSSPRMIARTLAAIEQQYYPALEVVVASTTATAFSSLKSSSLRLTVVHAGRDDLAELARAAFDAACGDFSMLLAPGRLLSRAALYRLAEALQSTTDPAIVFGDEDRIDDQGRRSKPWMKPQWDLEHMLAQDYVSGACAIDTRLAAMALGDIGGSGEAAPYALVLAASRLTGRPIIHVPFVLTHQADIADTSHQLARIRVVGKHVAREGAAARAGDYDTVRVVWPLPANPPSVAIIIPTRDKVDLLRACVESVIEKTSYANYEIIIVDNGSIERRTKEYFSDIDGNLSIRVITDRRAYNYSELNNFAAAQSDASFLCLLNNDTEVITGDWLSDMMRYAARPETGAVGAKLVYDDGSIQHAGVVLGICGAAGHAHRFTAPDDPGYFALPQIARRVSAVTGACLVVEKRKFDAVGGLDAVELPVAYNDVDLCMKLDRAGWRNMYVPHAVLYHHESKSRGNDFAPGNIQRYRGELSVLTRRWKTDVVLDPWFSPNLDRNSETFLLNFR